jgi:hypothetical protein
MIVIVAFILGFIAHAYFYTPGNPLSLGRMTAPVVAPVVAQNKALVGDKPLYEIDYVDGNFTPSFTSVRYGRYIMVFNKTTSRVWFVSDYPELNTVRPYGESEALKIRADRIGTFKLSNKLNLNASATITVVK